jgi:hypothetical protein
MATSWDCEDVFFRLRRHEPVGDNPRVADMSDAGTDETAPQLARRLIEWRRLAQRCERYSPAGSPIAAPSRSRLGAPMHSIRCGALRPQTGLPVSAFLVPGGCLDELVATLADHFLAPGSHTASAERNVDRSDNPKERSGTCAAGSHTPALRS